MLVHNFGLNRLGVLGSGSLLGSNKSKCSSRG